MTRIPSGHGRTPRRERHGVGLAFIGLISLAGGAATADLSGSDIRSVTVTGSLAARVKTLGRGGADVAWLAWTVPAVEGARGPCCFHGGGWRSVRPGDGVCRLERSEDEWMQGSSDDEPADPNVRVLLRLAGGRVDALRVLSAGCPVDAGELALYRLDGVVPGDSVAFLRALAEDDSSRKLAENAIMAVALHQAPEAQRALQDWTSDGAPRVRRERAAFWLGAARGEPGFERLEWMLEHESDDDVREQVVFAISISPAPRATALLMATARRNPNARMRSQALFWLAQEAGERVTTTLREAVDDDPDAEVRRQAVFAVSQLPKDEGVPMLIDLAENHRQPEVRKAALFWLGQSGDPRALDLIGRILSR